MTFVKRILWAVFAILLVAAPLYAQSLDTTIITSGGLTINYPSIWTAEETAPLTLNLRTADDWLIVIHVGEEAFYDFNGNDPQTSALEAMNRFTAVLEMANTVIANEKPLPVQIGGHSALQQAAVSDIGLPYEIITFNLADGTVVLAYVGNESTPLTLTSEIRSVFHAVLASVALSDPLPEAVTEVDPTATEEVIIPEGAVALADLEPGTVRFEQGVELEYPEGWTLYSEAPYIESTATLLYGDTIFNYEALALVTIQDSTEMSIDMFRSSLLSINAMLYTGQDDYDAARDIITETLPDDRVIEFLDTSVAEQPLGNTYLIPLDARYWAWVMFTNVPENEDKTTQRFDEVMTMVKSIAFVQQDNAFMHEGYYLTVQPATCDRPLSTSDINQSVPYAVFECPANCLDESYDIWGTDTYTLDSTICASAIHAGAISNAEGGTVLTTWLRGQTSYTGTEQNGVLTEDYGEWGDSYSIAPFVVPEE